MNQEFGRKYSMGVNALAVHETQPDTDPGTSAAAIALKEATERFAIVAAQQRNGLVEKHSGAQEKERLRRAMISGPIAHMANVGKVAAREHHELGSVFRFRPDASTFLAFRTAAGTMAESAETHRETLVKYGLAAPVLDQFKEMLEQFDSADTLVKEARRVHVAATRELETLADQIVRTVRVLDFRNRQRFQDNEELLGSWISATKILGAPRGGSSPAPADVAVPPAGDVRPAA